MNTEGPGSINDTMFIGGDWCHRYDGQCGTCSSLPDCSFCTTTAECKSNLDFCSGASVTDRSWCAIYGFGDGSDGDSYWGSYWHMNRWRVIGGLIALIVVLICVCLIIATCTKQKRRNTATTTAATAGTEARTIGTNRQSPRRAPSQWMPRWAPQWPRQSPMLVQVYAYEPAGATGAAHTAVPIIAGPNQPTVYPIYAPPGYPAVAPMVAAAPVPAATQPPQQAASPAAPTTAPTSPQLPATNEIHVHLNNLPPVKLPDNITPATTTQQTPVIVNFTGAEMSAPPQPNVTPRRRDMSPHNPEKDYNRGATYRRADPTEDTVKMLRDDLAEERKRNQQLTDRVEWLQMKRREDEDDHIYVGHLRD